ncbi:transketolase [bacterium]|nr:transketolase [bacterium]
MLPDIVKTIKGLTLDATRQAASGHPGAVMGTALLASVLWTDYLRFDPDRPDWKNRDRFVLSCGHASMLLYAMLYLTGSALSLSDIRNFRQLHSITPGHPEYHLTPGVEATTGPLGTGFATAVGMAVAERFFAARYNQPGLEVVDYNTYVLASDGDIMEGITNESASFAGHQRLSKLICLYDSNRITIDGSTSMTFSEDVLTRFKAMGWFTQEVDGQNAADISAALATATQQHDQPNFILCHTHIGEGSPNTQDTPLCHGSPLSPEEIALTKKAMDWPQEPFYVPQNVTDFFKTLKKYRKQQCEKWSERYHHWQELNPLYAREWDGVFDNTDLFQELDTFSLPKKASLATRSICQDVIRISYKHCPTLMGGSADLAGSVKTEITSISPLSPDEPDGRRIFFGIRENAMGAILNGLALSSPIRPFGGTFLVFSDFMKPGIRLAALMKLPVIYLFSHDSYAVGEDGPTHQPVEQIMNLRSVPNLFVFRPADIKETIGAWKLAWQRKDGPSALITSRQTLPVLDHTSRDISRGGYILYDPPGPETPDLLLIATGSEVGLSLETARQLELQKIRTRVVSLPCWELFDLQPEDYRLEILSPKIKTRISIEAGITLGWDRYAPFHIGLDRFGASGPHDELSEYFGFTVKQLIQRITSYMKYTRSH